MMTKPLLLAILTLVILSAAAFGQANNSSNWQTPGNIVVGGVVQMCLNASSQAIPCSTPATGAGNAGYPPGATPVENAATGTTAGATATLPAVAGQFTYLCGFHVEAGTATAAVTVNVTTTGLGSNLATGANSPATAATATAGPVISQVFTPCLRSSAVNTAITVVASALGAGGVNQDVNAWGFQQ